MVLPRHAGKVPVIDEEATLRFVSQFTGPIHHLTVPQLRRLARERGLSRQLYTYGRRADLIEALNQ
jgi:hypothetical protein